MYNYEKRKFFANRNIVYNTGINKVTINSWISAIGNLILIALSFSGSVPVNYITMLYTIGVTDCKKYTSNVNFKHVH